MCVFFCYLAFGAEEILFSKLGNGEVDCIEPDKFSCDVSLHFMQKMGVENMKIHNIPFQSFEGDKKFDLIYASSPSDWMRRDFREIVPEKYMHFFNQFSSDKSFIVINFYGGEYSYYLLRSAWFLNSLMNKFEEESNFRLLEYIISNSGNHASAILSNFKFEIKNDNFLKLFSKRQGEDSVVNFKIDKFGIPKISKFESTIFPYLALVKKIRLEIAKKIKRILTSRTGK